MTCHDLWLKSGYIVSSWFLQCLESVFSIQVWAEFIKLIWLFGREFMQQRWVDVPTTPSLAGIHIALPGQVPKVRKV